MKTIILGSIMSVIISATCCAQVTPPKGPKQFDFSSIETKVSEAQKLELLKRLVISNYLIKTSFKSSDSYDFENYHLLDFNADGSLDVIYDGRNPMGIETNNVVFYLYKEDSLRPVIKLNGDFTKIEIKDNLLQGFQLVKSPCCANYIYRIEDYEFNNSDSCFVPQNGNHEDYKYSYGQLNANEFCVSLINQSAYVMKTEFPAIIESKGIYTVSDKALLTPKPYKPSSRDFNEDVLAFHYLDNKAIVELPKGTKCAVLSEKSNEHGDIYCFIVFILDKSERNYMSEIKFKQYGWINKKNLK